MATIREKGPHQWQAQIRRKGWPQQSATFRTKKDAQTWARKVESEMDRGAFVDQEASRQTALGDLIRVYLKEVTDNRPSEASRIAERSRLERFLRDEPALCAYAVANLRPEHFEAYRDRRLSENVSRGNGRKKGNDKRVSPGTVKRELTLLKRVIDYRKRRLGLLINPVNTEDVKRPAVSDERDVRLSPDEMQGFLAACRDARTPWLRPIVEFALETGARRGNILRLRWEDIDLAKKTAILRGVKNSRSPDEVLNHTVALSPAAIRILKELPKAQDERVFPVTETALRLAFNRARGRAGVPQFRFHDLRHERTSSLFEAGWSLVQVMAQTGHKDPKSVKRYANLSADFLAEELAKLHERQQEREEPSKD